MPAASTATLMAAIPTTRGIILVAAVAFAFVLGRLVNHWRRKEP